MWYNTKTNQLQSEPPYRGWLHPEEVPILYPEWNEVDSNFVLPVKEKSVTEKINEIESFYSEKVNALTQRLVVATLSGTDTEALKLEYTNLITEKENKILDVIGESV